MDNDEERFFRESNTMLIAMKLAQRRDFKGARQVVERIPADFEEAAKIKMLNLPYEKLDPKQSKILKRAWMHSTVLIVIVEELAKAKQLQNAAQNQPRELPRSFTAMSRPRRVASIAADIGEISMTQTCYDGIQNADEKDIAAVCLVRLLSSKVRLNEAVALSEQIQANTQQATAFLEIACGHAAHGNALQVHEYFEKARSSGTLRPEEINKGAVRIVTAYSQSAQFAAAEDFTSSVSDPETRSQAYESIVTANWQKSDKQRTQRLLEKSRQAAKDIVNLNARCSRLRDLAVAFARTLDVTNADQSMKTALAIANKLESHKGARVDALTEIAISQVEIGEPEDAELTFSLAATVAGREEDLLERAYHLQKVFEARSRVGNIDQAIRAARAEQSEFAHSQMLLGIAKGLLDRQKYN